MPADPARYRGAVQIEGPDFLKGKRKFATTVHSLREFDDAIQTELESLHLQGKAIADQPFKLQWFSEAFDQWKELDDLSILEVVSGQGIRLVPVYADAPIKTQDDWDFSKVRKREQIARGRKASFIPETSSIRQGAVNRLNYDWTSDAVGNHRQERVDDIVAEFRERDADEPVRSDPPGIFLWRFKITIKKGSCCYWTCCLAKYFWCVLSCRMTSSDLLSASCCSPCCFAHYKPIAAYIYAHSGEYEDVQRCIRKGQDINERDVSVTCCPARPASHHSLTHRCRRTVVLRLALQ
jgi:hypothetical protein